MTPNDAPRIVETHISTLFFSADRVYKLAKRVDLPFLHAVDIGDRLQLADRELELNRRFAPDVYLGHADVWEDERVVDRMIVMRRLPEARRLSTLLHDSDADQCLRDVARQISTVHEAVAPIHGSPSSFAEKVAQNWADNFDVLHAFIGSIIDAAEFERVRLLAEGYLAQCRGLFEQRMVDGFVRDGHGDLTADDIYCLDDGPRILDGLAFDDGLRVGDVLSDIAFLVMDVERHAGPALGAALMRSYHEFTNEQHPSSLAHHYVAYRAHVRAKVACLRADQGDPDSVDLARRYHRLALDHLERARVRVVLIGGGPGVGKTLLSRRLADHYGYVRLATDVLRHDVARIPHGQHAFAEPDSGAYVPEVIDATYNEQAHEVRELLRAGHGVVLDASWSSERHRASLRQIAAEFGIDVVEVECVLDDDIARERIARRLANPNDPSDATPELVALLHDRREPWPSARRLSTAPTINDVVAAALEIIEKAP
jgi:aminoglycoside phosphotransferase family enzyme/predicted kinase